MKNEFSNWYVASVVVPIVGKNYCGWKPCIDWCKEVFGGANTNNTNVGNGWRYCSEGVFEFEREADLTAFLLRWG